MFAVFQNPNSASPKKGWSLTKKHNTKTNWIKNSFISRNFSYTAHVLSCVFIHFLILFLVLFFPSNHFVPFYLIGKHSMNAKFLHSCARVFLPLILVGMIFPGKIRSFTLVVNMLLRKLNIWIYSVALIFLRTRLFTQVVVLSFIKASGLRLDGSKVP